jgi:hypothetical protein
MPRFLTKRRSEGAFQVEDFTYNPVQVPGSISPTRKEILDGNMVAVHSERSAPTKVQNVAIIACTPEVLLMQCMV